MKCDICGEVFPDDEPLHWQHEETECFHSVLKQRRLLRSAFEPVANHIRDARNKDGSCNIGMFKLSETDVKLFLGTFDALPQEAER